MITEYRLTRESARSANACYNDARIAELVPPDGLTLQQVAELPIPEADRTWAIICATGVPYQVIQPWVTAEVERAIRTALQTEKNPAWRQWAERWLSGADRTAEAAEARAAWAEARAAWAAAAEARAAWAEARAAWAAAWAAWAEAAEARAAEARAAEAARAAGTNDDQLDRLVQFLTNQEKEQQS